MQQIGFQKTALFSTVFAKESIQSKTEHFQPQNSNSRQKPERLFGTNLDQIECPILPHVLYKLSPARAMTIASAEQAEDSHKGFHVLTYFWPCKTCASFRKHPHFRGFGQITGASAADCAICARVTITMALLAMLSDLELSVALAWPPVHEATTSALPPQYFAPVYNSLD